MAKFYGIVGYVDTVDKGEGVWVEEPIERNYYGDVLRNNRRLEVTDRLNDNININNQISIVADAFAYDNFFKIRYVKWMGTLWKVTNVEPQRPRLILTLGGVYNAYQERTSNDTGRNPWE